MSSPQDRFPPSLEHKRAMLNQSIDQLRAKGYEAEINLIALECQESSDEELIEKQRKNLEETRDNAYKAARRLESELKKLPAPKKDKASVNPKAR